MAAVYKHFLSTGSGSNRATLTFRGQDVVEIAYVSNWMGLGKKSYVLRGVYRHLSDLHGFFRLTSVRIEHTAQTIRMDQLYRLLNPSEPSGEGRSIYRQITYEYLRLPESQVFLAPDPELQFMKYEFFHSADWNERFDLILLALFVPWDANLEKHELGGLLHSLEGLKFLSVSPPDKQIPKQPKQKETSQ